MTTQSTSQIKLNTPLTTDEIDFRVQSVGSYKKGTEVQVFAIMLAYKDARVDMKRLDDVYGVDKWQKTYEIINGNLFCKVGIYSETLSQWIWKMDVGVPSKTEGVKGEASDAFKRACFNLGIGRELYEYPSIFINLNEGEYQQKGDKYVMTPKFQKGLVWQSGFNVDGKLVLLTCVDSNGKTRFNYSVK